MSPQFCITLYFDLRSWDLGTLYCQHPLVCHNVVFFLSISYPLLLKSSKHGCPHCLFCLDTDIHSVNDPADVPECIIPSSIEKKYKDPELNQGFPDWIWPCYPFLHCHRHWVIIKYKRYAEPGLNPGILDRRPVWYPLSHGVLAIIEEIWKYIS